MTKRNVLGCVGLMAAAFPAAGQSTALVDLTLDRGAQHRMGPLSLAGADGCASDDFNRPDGPIGGAWGPGAGNFANWVVSGNRGAHLAGSLETIVHTTASEPFASSVQVMDVQTSGTALQYIALMGGLGGGGNIFVKVQQQDGLGMFHVAGFYSANNVGSWPVMTGGGAFFTLNAPFAAARLTVSVDAAGDMVTLDIDTDFNGTPEQTYSRGGASSLAAGTGFGLGGFGSTTFDNWSTCQPTTCYPDCNEDGALTVADFGCFQTRFVAADPYADCNGDSALTVADFGCFQTQFVAGCP
jgi:hypothetical protein